MVLLLASFWLVVPNFWDTQGTGPHVASYRHYGKTDWPTLHGTAQTCTARPNRPGRGSLGHVPKAVRFSQTYPVGRSLPELLDFGHFLGGPLWWQLNSLDCLANLLRKRGRLSI